MKTIFGKEVCETLEEVLNPDTCAVLPIDLQNDFMHPAGKVAANGTDISTMETLRVRSASFIDGARELGVPIFHIQMIDLPNGMSDSPSWLRTKGLINGSKDLVVEGTWGAEFVEGCEPLPGEPVIRKHRSSAFTKTTLDQVLRSNNIETVVVIGEQTPGCVEATFRDAAYHDYYNVLVEDCVAAQNQELHEASIKIQRARHDVATAEEVLAIWRKYRT